MRWAASVFLGCVAFATAAGGCNAILDNRPGQPKGDAPSPNDEGEGPGGDVGPPSSDPSKHAEDPPDAADPDASGDSGCEPSARLCHGACVPLDDPAYGCGSAECEPCPAGNGQATCREGACALGACEPGFADCNRRADDGCEVALSSATSCGGCDVVCPASRPICAPSAETFVCTTACPPDAPLLCGAECVSPSTNPKHCGDCDVACPEIANGTAVCEDGVCGFSCKPGFRACGGRCVVATDPTACGPTCRMCPVPAGAVATCLADTCGIQCRRGYGDCNLDPSDGCETDLESDALHCGACGESCDGAPCEEGKCRPASPPEAAP